MKKFSEIVYESSIDNFMSKVYSCKTKEGLDELEKYYTNRVKETNVHPSDDIAMRDAILGRRKEFESNEPKKEEDSF